MAASTFELARTVSQWANELGGGHGHGSFQADDLTPVCSSAPLKKLVGWCTTHLRNKETIRAVLRERRRAEQHQVREAVKKAAASKAHKVAELDVLLERQRHLKGSIKKALESVRKLEAKEDVAREEAAALRTRHQIFVELASKREKELKTWADTLLEVGNPGKLAELSESIHAMKRLSDEAAASAASRAVLSYSAGAVKKAKKTDASSVVSVAEGSYKQTDAEIQAHILREYLTACAVMTNVNTKHSLKMAVQDEHKDSFKNALAVEIARSEKNCLRGLLHDIEGAVLQVQGGPMELQRQRERSKQLQERTAHLKKKIATQARRNVLLDRRLEEISAHIFDGAPLPDDAARQHDITLASALDITAAGPAGGAASAVGGSLGDVLDGEVEEMTAAVASVSGCWLAQSQALARVAVPALRRIVPERSAVQFDASDAAAAANVALPVPVEDYSTRQAADGSSLFRLLAAELGLPSGLSAAASLEAAAAMGAHARLYEGEEVAVAGDGGEDVDGARSRGPPFPEVAVAACVTTEALVRRTGAHAAGSTSARGDDEAQETHRTVSLVDAMLGAAGRLERCLGDAAALRASLQRLREEERLTGVALRDYDERPADNL